MPDKEYILKKVKSVVHTFDQDAEIILYGSRARDTATLESDWDFLILTSIEFDHIKKQELRHAIYEIEWDTYEVITSIIHKKTYWHRSLNKVTPFYQNVTREGISV